MKLLIALVENLDEIITTIIQAIPEIIVAIANAFWDNQYQIVDAGRNLIEGLWKGVKSIWESIKGWISEIADSVATTSIYGHFSDFYAY